MSAPVNGHGLGRLYVPDERDRKYTLAALPLPPADRSKTWTAGFNLDQGDTPMCVAYSTATAIMAAPYLHRDLEQRCHLGDIYTQAQQLDEFPGPPPAYDGTSVRAGCKAWQARGFIAEYRWASSVDEVLSALVHVAPVVIGTDWLAEMFTPDHQGVIHARGEVVGGHAYCLVGYNHDKGRVRILNSWGRSWGQNGRAWLGVDDLATLLASQGEAAVLLDVKASEFNKEHPLLGI